MMWLAFLTALGSSIFESSARRFAVSSIEIVAKPRILEVEHVRHAVASLPTRTEAHHREDGRGEVNQIEMFCSEDFVSCLSQKRESSEGQVANPERARACNR